MKSLKKFALATMTCAALLGFAATSHAAYQLSDEVKTAEYYCVYCAGKPRPSG